MLMQEKFTGKLFFRRNSEKGIDVCYETEYLFPVKLATIRNGNLIIDYSNAIEIVDLAYKIYFNSKTQENYDIFRKAQVFLNLHYDFFKYANYSSIFESYAIVELPESSCNF